MADAPADDAPVDGGPVVERWTRLVWAGDVDSFAVETLEPAMREACDRGDRVEVDLSGVTFMDCAGLGRLLAARGRLTLPVRVFAPSPAVARLLGVLGLGDAFDVVGPAALDARATPGSHPSGAGELGQGADEPAPTMPRSLTDRASIEQSGLLMGREGCSAAEAWQLLLGLALLNDVRIRVMARMLIDGSSRRPDQPPTPQARRPSPTRTVDPDDVHAELLRSGTTPER